MIEYKDFLRTASEILESSKDEAGKRNSISRAYYGAYHACKHTAKVLNIPECSGQYGVHSKLIQSLINDGRTHYLGQDLHTLKVLRNKADYVLDAHVSLIDAKSSIKQAAYLLKDAEKIRLAHSESV